jgi:hypothetical protein
MIGFWVPERSACPRWSRAERAVFISGMSPHTSKGITLHKAPAEFIYLFIYLFSL